MKYKFKLFNNGCLHRKSWGMGTSSSGGSLLDLPPHLELSLVWELPASYAAAAASSVRMEVRIILNRRHGGKYLTRQERSTGIYHMLHKSKHSYLLQCAHSNVSYQHNLVVKSNPCFQNIDLLHFTNLF